MLPLKPSPGTRWLLYQGRCPYNHASSPAPFLSEQAAPALPWAYRPRQMLRPRPLCWILRSTAWHMQSPPPPPFCACR